MPRLAPFLREHHAAVTERWAELARIQAPAASLSWPELTDNVPGLMRNLEQAAEAVLQGLEPELLPENPRVHALQRLSLGYDLSELVAEYTLLRESLFAVWDQIIGARMDVRDITILNRAVDQAIAISVEAFIQARERTLKALDVISQAVLDRRSVEQSLEETLRSLAVALVETTPAVDSIVILLLEGGRLLPRAWVGVEADPHFSLAIGEGFSGSIAARLEPRMLHDAAENPLVRSLFLRTHGTKALYGVPLLHGDELVGVAHMGSRLVNDFSEEDKALFRTMSTRAAGFIVQAQLVEQMQRREEDLRQLAAERGTLLVESERKTAELEAVIGGMPEAVYIGDSTGIKRVNQPALDLLGFSSLDDLNRNIRTLAEESGARDPDTGALLPVEANPFLMALGGEAGFRDVATRHRKSGKTLVIRSSAAPVRVAGTVVGAVAINIDVTERTRYEQEIRGRMEFEKHLIGIVSHDLRTPLTSIIVTCQSLLRNQELPDRVIRGVLRVLNSGERAARMISDLLDFTRARHSGIPIQRAPVDLHELVRRTVEEVHAAFPDRTVHVDTEGNGQGDWDSDRLAQIVTNLTRNAFTYSPEDTPVRLRTRGDDGWVVLTVHNEGDPIPAEKLPRLFEPMQRATASGEQRNIGLGLYIVDAVVKAHGGTVGVESSRECGTTFTVRLPRHP